MKLLALLLGLLPLVIAASGCDDRQATERRYKNRVHGYTILVPGGWTVKEDAVGTLRIEAPGALDANGVPPTIHIMVADRPSDWSWDKDVADMPNQLDNYQFIDKGIREQAGVSYSWLLFAYREIAVRYMSFNCVVPFGEKVITLGCFAEETRFPELEADFRKSAFSIDPGGKDQL